MQRALAVLAFVRLLGSCAFAQVDDEFARLDGNVWCPCQIDTANGPLSFPPDSDDDRVISIPINPDIRGENPCDKASECPTRSEAFLLSDLRGGIWEEDYPAESLGPNFVDRFLARQRLLPLREMTNPYCEDTSADACIQRQELRFQPFLKHAINSPHIYSFRFRMLPEEPGDKEHSVRWVTAQWKQEPVSDDYRDEYGQTWSPSPFLSQRYDNGVLHVTVADEDCRCTVASAPLPGNIQPPWRNGRPTDCVSTLEQTSGEQCFADLDVTYGKDPVLPSPAGAWVEMSYRVEAGLTGHPVIEIKANGEPIATVTGKIGYKPKDGETSVVKFKIGHYRDFMPFEDQMEIDWLKMSPAP